MRASFSRALARPLALLLALALCASGAVFSRASGEAEGNVIPSEALPERQDESVPPDLSLAASAVLLNLDSGDTLYELNGDAQVYPASTVKLMTALVAYDALSQRLDETVTVPEEVPRDAAGVKMSLLAGENVTVRQLFAGLMVAGANDAAMLLANLASGSTELFVAKMNERAQDLGLSSTRFANVTGVDDVAGQTSARDVAALGATVYANQFLSELAAIPLYEIPATNLQGARNLHARNYFLSRRIYPYYYDPDVTGLNAGATVKGGNCLVATKSLGNVRYLAVVMGAQETSAEYNGQAVTVASCYKYAQDLFKWGSRNFVYKTVISPMSVLGEVHVDLAVGSDAIPVCPTRTIQVFLPEGTSLADAVRVKPTLEVEELQAPVEEGLEVGSVTVYGSDGQVIDSCPLVTKLSASLSRSSFLWTRLRSVLQTKLFRRTVLILAAAMIVAVLITARVRYVRAKRRVEEEERRG